MRKKPIIALIYDFDGTLSPGNMQEFGFIQALGQTPEEFWTKCNELAVHEDASNILSYMKTMIDDSKAINLKLRQKDLNKFGEHIELYDGVKSWFKSINEYGKEHGVVIEHYINSSGLIEFIQGTPIADEFKHIYACSFLYNEKGEATWPAVAVDYTAKTQALFKINKGLFAARDTNKVNESVNEDAKRIPFQQMIYLGDGDTDVPCMKIVKMFGGNSIAVFNPDNEKKRAQAQKLLRQGRVNFITPANYTKESRTYRLVCTIIDKIKAECDLMQYSRYR